MNSFYNLHITWILNVLTFDRCNRYPPARGYWRPYHISPLNSPLTPAVSSGRAVSWDLSLHSRLKLTVLLEFSLAHLTSGHSGPELPGLQCLGDWSGEHLPVLDGGEPEGELVSEVVTGSSGSVTLNERRGSEVFETRSWAGERLTSSLRTSCSVLKCKQVSDLATSHQIDPLYTITK